MNTKTEQLTRLVLRPGQWCERFNEHAQGIPHDDPANLAAGLLRRINSGSAKVAEVAAAGRVVGFIVYDLAFGGRELVLLAGYGRDGRNLANELRPHVEALARQLGCSSIRFHTMRPGLVRRAVAAGYHVGEIILRKNLS